MTTMPQHEVIATSLVAMVPTGFAATFHHMRAGNVHFRGAITIGGACAVAMYSVATYVAPHVDEATLRKIFSGLLLFSSARMLI